MCLAKKYRLNKNALECIREASYIAIAHTSFSNVLGQRKRSVNCAHCLDNFETLEKYCRAHSPRFHVAFYGLTRVSAFTLEHAGLKCVFFAMKLCPDQ